MQLFRENLRRDFRLYCMGDAHLGLAAHHRNGWLETIERIHDDKYAQLILMGDLIESREITHPYYSFEDTDRTNALPLTQARTMAADLKPIRKKILCALDGNHEQGLSKSGTFMRDAILDAIDLKHRWGTFSSKIAITGGKSDKLRFKTFATHGAKSLSGAGDTPLARRAFAQKSLMKRLERLASDCLIMVRGHSHTVLSVPPQRNLSIYDDGAKLKQNYHSVPVDSQYIPPELRHYGCTGSFLRTQVLGHSGYGERGEYPPHELGYLIYHVSGQDVHCEEVII